MKEKIENNIEKDIEKCKELIRELGDYKLNRIEDSISLSNVLSELESYKGKIIHLSDEEYNKVIENAQKDIKSELETYKKMCQKLAQKIEEIAYEVDLDKIYAELHNCEGIERNWNRGTEAEIEDIIKWARNEVKKDEC